MEQSWELVASSFSIFLRPALKLNMEFIAISETIGKHEKRQFSEERQLKKLIKQKSGLMDDLLTGRVRVKPMLEKARSAASA